MNIEQLCSTLPSNSTYLELLSSLVNILTRRLIKFYKHQTQDELIFKQQVQQIQDSLTYYQQFKPPPIKYSSLLQPLANHLRLNTFKQYFSVPAGIIDEVPGKQCQTQITVKSTKKRIYSSNNSLDANQTVISNNNLKYQKYQTSPHLWTSHDKTRGSSVYLPGVIERGGGGTYGTTRKGRSLKSHNYQKEVTKAYNRIIGTVINSKTFKRKKYQCKIQNIVRSVEDPEQE